MDPKRPEWQRAFEWASWSQRIELGFVRGAVALLIPVSLTSIRRGSRWWCSAFRAATPSTSICRALFGVFSKESH